MSEQVEQLGSTPDSPKTASTAEVPGEIPPASPPPVWVSPATKSSGGGRKRRGFIFVVIAAVVLAVGYFSLVFLGNQVQSILAGTIEFGTGGTDCSVTGGTTTFPATSTIRSVAHLERETRVGEIVTVTLTYPDATTETESQTMTTTSGCVIQDFSPGAAPGHYVLEYRTGSEVLAKGGFDIKP